MYEHPIQNRHLRNVYDNEAPLNFLATQTPSLVRILWTDLVSGSTYAASSVSSVTRP
jgi:hypothetical protein